MTNPESSSRLSSATDSSVYFLGDSHLGAEDHAAELAKEQDLVTLLAHLRGRASVLYLMGDLFDFWFEYPTVIHHEHFRTVRALSELAESGTEIRFMGGNHDYWAGKNFSGMTGARVFPDSIEETHLGRRIFIAHGDGLPPGDASYKILKRFLRSRLSIGAFRLLHPTVGSAMARWASQLSAITEERIQRALPPMMIFLREKLDSGFDAVVVGHVHRPLLMTHGNRAGVIVGDWMWNRSVVRLDARGFSMLRWNGERLVPIDAREYEPPLIISNYTQAESSH